MRLEFIGTRTEVGSQVSFQMVATTFGLLIYKKSGLEDTGAMY